MQETDDFKTIPVGYASSISTHVLVMCLLGYRESDNCIDEVDKDLIGQAVGHILVMQRIVRFWFAGFVVTNVLWAAHAMGYF
jgi:hypothetical protein